MDIPYLFDCDKEIVTYRDEDELIGRVREVLRADELRARLGAGAQRRACSDHTYLERMKHMLAMMDS